LFKVIYEINFYKKKNSCINNYSACRIVNSADEFIGINRNFFFEFFFIVVICLLKLAHVFLYAK